MVKNNDVWIQRGSDNFFRVIARLHNGSTVLVGGSFQWLWEAEYFAQLECDDFMFVYKPELTARYTSI